ncbi:hypothetical protein, partial [Kosakonia cowanii]|uniref:hypothetical protein n=1 Tax=Kosakonia cowanii TaxID=208223 RepID=UPI00289F2E20
IGSKPWWALLAHITSHSDHSRCASNFNDDNVPHAGGGKRVNKPRFYVYFCLSPANFAYVTPS